MTTGTRDAATRSRNETQIRDIRKFAKSAGDLIGSVESAAMSGETDRLKAGAAALRIYLDALERMADGEPRGDTAFAGESSADEADEGTTEAYEKRLRKAAEKVAPGEDVQTAMTKLAKSDEGKRLKRETNQARALDVDIREGMSKAGNPVGGNVEEQIKRMAKSKGISISEAYQIVKAQHN